MSLMSPDEPMIRPLTQCPYCDHDSPEGSKFCNACGAALHLVPCPHCGAVNDVSKMDECGSCHGDLRVARARAPRPSEPVAEAHAEAATTTELAALTPVYALDPAPAPAPEAARLHSPGRGWPGLAWGLAALALLLLLAALGYRQWRPGSQPAAATDAAVPVPARETTTREMPAREVPARDVPAAVPVEAAPPAQEFPKAAAAPASATVLPSDAAVDNPGRPVARAAPRPPRPAPAAARLPQGPEQQELQQNSHRVEDPVLRPTRPAPPSGPCTEAVAALGLCSPEARPRSP